MIVKKNNLHEAGFFSLNLNGKLIKLSSPVVMGILNVTPDSFYDGGRYTDEAAIVRRTEQLLAEGALILDIGAYSTRPNAITVSQEEEWARLSAALKPIRREFPNAYISIDTFRAEVARQAKLEFDVAMINDISGGTLDERMFETAAQLQIPYILMHTVGDPQTMTQNANYTDGVTKEVLLFLAEKTEQLRLLGVNDIIIDPGFGFAKNLNQNYELLASLPEFAILNLPLLVGFSRKSMFYKLLGITPEESLNATTAGNTLALLGGANILRVHDVREAVQAIRIVEKLKENTNV